MTTLLDSSLYTTRGLLGLPPAEWLMEGLIPTEGFVGLYGAPGSGKSFIALDWALCVSAGRDWMGHPTQQAPVVYVAAEGGRGIQQRVRAWMLQHGVTDMPNILWRLVPLHVRESGVAEDFLDDLQHVWNDEIDIPQDVNPGLLVLDTLSRCFTGDENAASDMAHFVEKVAFLTQDRAMACVVVHHTNKAGTDERGSTAFRGAADAMFHCVGIKDKESKRLIRVDLLNDKQKDDIEAEPIYMAPFVPPTSHSIVLVATDAPPKKEKGNRPEAPLNKPAMLAVLAGAPEGLTAKEWLLITRIPRRTFFNRVKQLLADNEIYKEENGTYQFYPAAEDVAALEREEE